MAVKRSVHQQAPVNGVGVTFRCQPGTAVLAATPTDEMRMLQAARCYVSLGHRQMKTNVSMRLFSAVVVTLGGVLGIQ